jgi:hypothetical protein
LIYPRSSSQSEIERQKIQMHSSNSNFTGLSPNEYFEDLINDNATLNATVPALDAPDDKESKVQVVRGPISKKQIKKLNLLDQIKIFLKEGKKIINITYRTPRSCDLF